MKKRVTVIFISMLVLFVGITARLYAVSQSAIKTVSGQQSSRVQTMAVSRGTVYDRYRRPLVNTTVQTVASVSPLQECLKTLRTSASEQSVQQLLAVWQTGERLLLEGSPPLPETRGIVQVEAPVRYAQQSLAVHTIGYIDHEGGVTGIEKGYDALLASYSGKATVSYQVDALGRVSMDTQDTLENTLAVCSGGVVLTLDAQIQQIVEEAALEFMERGAVVVSDAQSGQILASVSLPLYDPNNVAAVLKDARAPLLDRALTNYNCGSVFKIITAAAALENGISADTVYTCAGSYEVNGVTFRCHEPLGEGPQTMSQAMANSCNCYFIQLALDVGAGAIYDMAVKAGFSSALSAAQGIETAQAVLPTRFDLSADAALANLAIGQGDLLASPYHINALLCAVINDGFWREPALYLGEINGEGVLSDIAGTSDAVRLFSAKTAAALGQMLCGVVSGGTGVSAAPAQGEAAGKTGTAETGWEVNGEEVVQSWFAGYYPADRPQYSITVLSENGGANGKAASVLFASICDALFQAGLV